MRYWKKCRSEDEKSKNKITFLGTGSFGDVYKCFDVAEKRFKTFYNSKLGIEPSFINEISITSKLNHPNIVNILGMYIINNKIYMYTKYAESNIHQMIILNMITKDNLLYLIHQIVSGIYYLHSVKVTHNDIKPENILVYYIDNKEIVRIADFGLSKYVNSIDTMLEIDNMMYNPPELIIIEDPNVFTTDMWQLGITILEMKTGNNPFDIEIRDPRDIKYNLANKMFDVLGQPPDYMIDLIEDIDLLEEIDLRDSEEWISEVINKEILEDVYNIIDNLLVWDPDNRFTISQLIKLPYFNLLSMPKIILRLPLGIYPNYKIINNRVKNILKASNVITLSPSYYLGIRLYDLYLAANNETNEEGNVSDEESNVSDDEDDASDKGDISITLICFHIAALMFEPSHDSWKRVKKIKKIKKLVWMSKITTILKKLEYPDLITEGDILYTQYDLKNIYLLSTLRVSLWILSCVYLDLNLIRKITENKLLLIIVLAANITHDWITIQRIIDVIPWDMMEEVLFITRKHGRDTKYHNNLADEIYQRYDVSVMSSVKTLTLISIKKWILRIKKNIKILSKWEFNDFEDYLTDLNFHQDKIIKIWNTHQDRELSYEIFYF